MLHVCFADPFCLGLAPQLFLMRSHLVVGAVGVVFLLNLGHCLQPRQLRLQLLDLHLVACYLGLEALPHFGLVHELSLQSLPVVLDGLLLLVEVVAHHLHRVLVVVLQTGKVLLPQHCHVHFQGLVLLSSQVGGLVHLVPQCLEESVVVCQFLSMVASFSVEFVD